LAHWPISGLHAQIEQLMCERALYAQPHQTEFPTDASGQSKGTVGQNVPNRQTRIMVVDDDPSIGCMVSDYLRQNNMHVAFASGRQDMSRLLANERFSMVILDLRLDQGNDFDVLRNLRACSNVPVIITTGCRHSASDHVAGLELGADDCITKPFSLRELLARIRAVLRRVETVADESIREPAAVKASTQLRFGSWALDRRTRQLIDEAGNLIALTKGEYALLLAFLDAPGRPLSREHLLQATRIHEDISDRSIDVQILRLRRKLATAPGTPSVIRTERGVGYVFTLPVKIA